MNHWPITLLSGFTSIINMFMPIIMARILSADHIGVYKIFFMYLSLIPNFAFTNGLDSGIFYWAGKKEKGNGELQTAISLLFVQGFLLVSVLAMFYPIVINQHDFLEDYFIFFLICILPTILNTFYESICYARGFVLKGAIFSSSFEFIRTTGILIVVLLTKDVEYALLVHFFVGLIKIGGSIHYSIKNNFIKPFLSLEYRKNVFNFSNPIALSSLLDVFINYADKFILSALIPAAQFALYSFGCLAIPILQVIEQSVNKVLMPKLTHLLTQSDYKEAVKQYALAVDEIIVFMIPSFVGLLCYSDEIITILFTEKYIEASTYLKIYSFSYLILSIPYDVAARATGRGSKILKMNIYLSAFSLTFVSLLTWKFGAVGAVVGYILTLVYQKILGVKDMVENYSWSLIEMFPVKNIMVYSAASILLTILSYLIKDIFESNVKWFLFVAPIFAISYITFVFVIYKKISPIKFFKAIRSGEAI